MGYVLFSIFLVPIHYGLWLLFVKAGRAGWESLIPIYREYVITKIVGRGIWSVILLIVPLVNIFVLVGLYLDLVKSFGKRRFWEYAATVLAPFAAFPYWGRDPVTQYLGKGATKEFQEKYPYKKSVGREWADAIVFAVVAATLIRGFLIEAYMIPTGSMEKSLLIGDFLFVSKLNYGPRVPMTPVAFPFAHHTMPLVGGKAYWDGIELPYKRLSGLQKIKRNDIIVFNAPVEATAPFFRPIDKRENIIKRTVGVPGDTITISNAEVSVNGEVGFVPPESQMDYLVTTDEAGLNSQRLLDMRIDNNTFSRTQYRLFLTQEKLAEVQSWPSVKHIEPLIDSINNPDPSLFSYAPSNPWNIDNFGPIIIPKSGWTVRLDSATFPIYQRAITIYEGNELENRADGYYLNGTKADSYTFQMDYYWMMGDNRHNSEDSRSWGFLPEDHVVGKALFIWLSLDEHGSFFSKIRWNRLFMGIK